MLRLHRAVTRLGVVLGKESLSGSLFMRPWLEVLQAEAVTCLLCILGWAVICDNDSSNSGNSGSKVGNNGDGALDVIPKHVAFIVML